MAAIEGESMSLLCTTCKDAGLGEPKVALYAAAEKVRPLTTSTEASKVTARDAINRIRQDLSSTAASLLSAVGRGLVCRGCNRAFEMDEERWQPGDGLTGWMAQDTYRVMSISEELANQRRVRAENAQARAWFRSRGNDETNNMG